MSEQLKHIFDISKCPTKRQLQDYLKGTMEPEEIYAFEHHISSCLLCSEALDGVMESKEEALAGVAALNNNFLKDHLELHPPHIHLNSIAPSVMAAGDMSHKRTATQSFWKPVGIAATLLLCIGLGWYFKNEWRSVNTAPIVAQNASALTEESAKDIPFAEQDVAETQAAKLAAVESSPPPDEKPSSSNSRALLLPGEREKEDTAPAATPAIAAKAALADADQARTPNLPETSAKKEETKTIALMSSPNTNKEFTSDIQPEHKKPVSDPVETEKTADELYKEEQYSKALIAYKKLMTSSDAETNQYARLMAAQCYLNLGQKQNAQKLLSELVENGHGSEKREAKRLLNKLEKAED